MQGDNGLIKLVLLVVNLLVVLRMVILVEILPVKHRRLPLLTNSGMKRLYIAIK